MSTAVAKDAAITNGDASTDARGKAPVAPSAVVAPATPFAAIFRKTKARGGCKRCIALFDFLLRLCAIGAALAATIAMGTSYETLSFFTEEFQFHASYSNFPPLTFFVIGNAIASGYLILSLPFSFVGVVRPHAGLRLLLLVIDVVMVGLTTAAASSAAAIVYLAHVGNSRANWVAICIRFKGFCEQTSGAVVASFLAVLILMLLVVISAISLRKH